MLLLLVMTIAELLTAAAENLSEVPSSMSAAHLSKLVRAVNGGVAEFARSLPDHRRVEQRTERLGAALSKTGTVTAGSKTITFDPAWSDSDQASYLGRSMVIAGLTDQYNRLAAASTLLLPWEGASGSMSLSIRSDAVVLGASEDCIDGEVVLNLGDRSAVLNFGRPTHEDAADVLRFYEAIPTNWWVEPLNGITGSSPLYVLRVFPQPDQICSLTFSRRLWPTAITSAMVSSTIAVPVLPHEEDSLVALCQEPLYSHPLWLGTADKTLVQQSVDRARGAVATQTPNRGHTQHSRVRTPKNY